MYTRILVWASTPVPVASEPRRDQDRDLRSRWHSMLEKLKFAIEIVDSWSVGTFATNYKTWGVFVVNVVKATADFMQTENETVSKMKLTNCVNQKAKNKRGLSLNGTDLRPGENSKYSQTWELRPPKGLGASGPIFQVVSFARFGSIFFQQDRWSLGAPQASYERRRHRNCFQTGPVQAFPKK